MSAILTRKSENSVILTVKRIAQNNELLPELPEDVPDLQGMKPRQKGRGFLIFEEDIKPD